MKQEKSQLKIGIILSYVNIGIGNLIPLFYTPIMLSLLGQHEYGLYKLAASVTSYLRLVSLGIGSALTRYLIKASEETGKEAEERVFGLFMVIFRIIAIATLLIGVVLISNLDIWYGSSLSLAELERMRLLIFILVCSTAQEFAASPYLAVATAHERFLFVQGANIAMSSATPLLNLLMLTLGFGSVGLALSSISVSLIGRAAYIYYVRKKMNLKPSYSNIPVKLLREILQFSFWVFLAQVVSQLYNTTDAVMIGAVPKLATTGVAVYSIGQTLTNMVCSLTTGVSTILAPKANKMVFGGASNEELTDLTIRVGRIQCYIISLLVTGFVVFGKPFIAIYAGNGYEDAYWVAILTMIPNMIPLVQSVCLNIITAQNKHKFRSLVYLGIAIANVIGTWYLMQFMGIIGAALMTGIALIIGQGFVMNWYYHSRTGLDMIRFWKEVGIVYLIPVGLCMVSLFLSNFVDMNHLWVMFVGILVYTTIYCLLCWKFTMNEYEKGLFRGLLLRIGIFTE